MAVRGGIVILLASFSLVTGTVTNIAERKPTRMSSAFDGQHPASKAVDGVTRADHSSYVVHTGAGQTTAWWKVDLQRQVHSARVILYFRTDYKKRRNGVQLYTSGSNSADPKEGNLCHTVTGSSEGTDIDDVLNVTCSETWPYLTVYTETANDVHGPVLDFAEVQVWTCSVGMYGGICNNECNSRRCVGPTESCDSITGACSSGACQIGWTGTDCAVCVDGKYGPGCAQDCSSRHCMVSSSTCGDITGTCPAGGCQDGWIGVDCSTACSSGKYGANCAKDCISRHCKTSSPTCHHISGACPAGGCKEGWMGLDCTSACASGTYGANCVRDCGSRHCKTSSNTCDHISGACPDDECEDGWMGTDCTTECVSGYDGANCGKNCSHRNCKEDSSCDRTQGLCERGCAAGYNGTDCTKACTSLMYGPNCINSCGARHCKTNLSTCDGVSGECLGGCEVGWKGRDCSGSKLPSTIALKNCPDGRYGPGCTEFCNSRNCNTPSPLCDITGSCTDGCREGWQNADCRIPCPSGTYGSNCSTFCDSRQCKTARAACDHESGACPTGCREGWIGADCIERCKPGTYGPDCSRCGHCDVTCNVEDGRCSGECLDGFSGDRCDVDVRATVAKIGITEGAVGMAVGIVVMLLLGAGLLKRGRLKWIPSNGADPQEGGKTGHTVEIPTHTPTPGVKNPDYTELNDVTREREEKSPYDVIQNQVYENNQI